MLWVHGGCLRHEQYTSLTIFEGEAYLKSARTAYSDYRDETNTRERGVLHVAIDSCLADFNCAGMHHRL